MFSQVSVAHSVQVFFMRSLPIMHRDMGTPWISDMGPNPPSLPDTRHGTYTLSPDTRHGATPCH